MTEYRRIKREFQFTALDGIAGSGRPREDGTGMIEWLHFHLIEMTDGVVFIGEAWHPEKERGRELARAKALSKLMSGNLAAGS